MTKRKVKAPPPTMRILRVEQVLGGWRVAVEVLNYYADGSSREEQILLSATGLPFAPSQAQLIAAVRQTKLLTEWIRGRLHGASA